jgi:glycosyltransferase involved in cell wall biosynthesis
MTAMRVLHLRDTDFLCGPGKTILETIRRNRDEQVEYEVCGFGSPQSNDYLGQVAEYAPVYGLPDAKRRLPEAARMLSGLVRERGYDIVHPHEFKTRFVCALASRSTEWPAEVTTLHGFIDVGLKGRIYNKIDLRLIRRLKRVLLVSEAMRARVAEWGLPKDRIDLVRNCIVLENYPYGERSQTLRREFDWPEDCFVIGHIGRLSAEKGQQDLIETFHQLAAEQPRLRLVIAGDGPDAQKLAAAVEAGPAADRVQLLGHRNDIRDVFGSLDLLVLNSLTEGLPNVVLEAMALGVSVVATAVGGTPELIEDGETGWLIPAGDPQALQTAIENVLQSTAECERRRRAARRRIENDFNMDSLIETTHSIYRRILAENGRRR